MRLGAFGDVLAAWAEQPCVLTLIVAETGARVRYTGILRAYHSVRSLHGWALVPPEQHGGFGSIRMTELALADAAREVVGNGPDRALRFAPNAATICELRRDPALLTAPPRRTRAGRYLYTGGRRRRRPERWMLG